MNYFAVFLKMSDPQKSQDYRPQHLDFLEKMRKEGHIFANGRFLDGAGGLVIYMAESEELVESYVKQDPYVIQHARDYEIHEWEMVTDEVKSE
jgi:3-hydroxyisobutyrate dehydrogenase